MTNPILVSHATAESENFLKKDFERDLEKSGVQEAINLGGFIKQKKLIPEQIVASSANRTLQTAYGLAGVIDFPEQKILQNPGLYNSGFQKIISEIQNTDISISTLAIVAHNPGISQACTAMAESGNYQMAPSAALCLRFNISDWKELKPCTGTEIWYYYP